VLFGSEHGQLNAASLVVGELSGFKRVSRHRLRGTIVAVLLSRRADGGQAMQIGVETSRMVENKRVFVVDDDDINRTVLQFMLQDDNETHEFASLAAAFTKAQQAQPDLLLLGLPLVLAAGASLIGEIAARWPGVRILLVGEAGQEKAAQPFFNSGAHGVLSKPFTVEMVRRKVDVQLGRVVNSLVQLQLVPAATR
jgi:CheY-like chemotaxis protein